MIGKLTKVLSKTAGFKNKQSKVQTTMTRHHKDLIVFLVSLLSQETGFLQLVLQGVHTLLISQGLVLEHFAGAGPNNDNHLNQWEKQPSLDTILASTLYLAKYS